VEAVSARAALPEWMRARLGRAPEPVPAPGVGEPLPALATAASPHGSFAVHARVYPGAFQQGPVLLRTLNTLEKFSVGSQVRVGEHLKTITAVIDIDGRKMILDDGSWIMIRPSGTEPKVRFYVEARNSAETPMLVKSAKSMLAEIGLLP
jgi:hypothetical protein